MPSSDHSGIHIPVHELQQRDLVTFDYKLYHLKGEYSMTKNLPSMPGETAIPHRHKYHELCFFSTGHGVHEIDFRKIEIRPASIHFVVAGQVHQLSGSQDVTGRVLAFSPGFLWNKSEGGESMSQRYPFLNPMNNVQSLHLSTGDFDSIMESVEYLARDGSEWKSRSTTIIQHHIQVILEKCNFFITRNFENNPETNPLENNIISNYKNLVEVHFKDLHQVQDYSKMLNITPGHLNRYCQEFSGMNASEIILQRIILEAKRMLLFTDESSKAIAYHLRFEDPSYFSRCFKRKTGYSPLNFRQLVREKYHR